jgi:putative Holliday junction resolvase
MRILAVDYGKARVGVAITDPLGLISQPLETFANRSQKEVIKRLKYLVQNNDVRIILVGNPLSMNGGSTPMSQHIEKFVARLRKTLTIEVKLWDERLTSKLARNRLKELGLHKDQKRIDQIAACIMLDEYLTSRTHCSA